MATHTLLDMMSDGAMLITRNAGIRFVNQSGTMLLHKTKEEIIGKFLSNSAPLTMNNFLTSISF